MGRFHDEANRRRRAAAKQAKATFVEMSLAGFRRRNYAGVFRKRESASTPTYLAEIKLDGFERSIEVRFTVEREAEGQRCWRGMLRGLLSTQETRPFDFRRTTDRPGHFQGVIELHEARLIISLVPAVCANGDRLSLCHLELVRNHD
ncbi:hypothetical protein N5A93_19050 [Roseovarius sp. EGI FJ00037]|uniref:hypothetical protein n=1 Tax=Roseovarius salincola TaxID=2978479 RepID=UPI0022A8CBB3|nr:hypothetical protein [Roseovarius sp. EGI FJ00037]MCZ0814321.1 hypothetical protein [Roseovarius sp. EGI FJ00037]